MVNCDGEEEREREKVGRPAILLIEIVQVPILRIPLPGRVALSVRVKA